jgi:small subunit ribosomal protein S1
MTSYGAFVQIQDDIDGMIHVSDMSWTRKINHPSEVLQKGDEVEAVILDIDPSQQRISLGMRQLMDDPWSHIDDKYTVGDLVEGVVSKLASFGAFVELEEGIDGLIHISQLSTDRVSRVRDVVNVGDTVKAQVVRIEADERRIGLSMRALQEESGDYMSDVDVQQAMADLRPGDDLVNVGSLMDSALAAVQPVDAPADSADQIGDNVDMAAAAAPAEAEEVVEATEPVEAEEVAEDVEDEEDGEDKE